MHLSACQLEEELIEHQTSVKDTIIHCVLQSMFTWLRQNSSKFSPNLSTASGAISIKNLLKKAELFFNLRDAVIKELDSAKSKWRTHLDLLSDIDEINQCQRSMRLAYEDENLFGLTPHEQAFIVQPYILVFKYKWIHTIYIFCVPTSYIWYNNLKSIQCHMFTY